ncbi:uncharacterized protein LY89DRAFT_665281 [Mollisia scopiformis]|uniref:Uncharacterized protein n=1 Tax=Mollisia scopiformis TaxID=149040 RepID=A0A194XQ17_MOLSC|nr:uncharacterized protein LY89DRAFT_665281 [Mollisia scopiformis]KUJ22149.1 hypothetical protein LY89DRAFT_665281 [Mollisia scopiformis]
MSPPLNNTSKFPNTSYITNEKIHRKAGANAEVSISIDGIVRNEVVDYTQVYSNGRTLPFRSARYDSSSYEFVTDLFKNMDRDTREEYLKNHCFELVVDERSFRHGHDERDFFEQLFRMKPTLSLIQRLKVKIIVPLGGCPILSDQNYAESPTRAFLIGVANEINYFHSLKRLDVVLALSKNFENYEFWDLMVYALPFCTLKNFPPWRLMHQDPGMFPPEKVRGSYVKRVNEKAAQLEKRKRQAVKAKLDAEDAIANASRIIPSAFHKETKENKEVTKKVTWVGLL